MRVAVVFLCIATAFSYDGRNGGCLAGPRGEACANSEATSASGKEIGAGGLETIVLRHRGASAEIYLFGATVCSYKTSNGNEHIFVSPGAVFDGRKAIRGGVPLVFPQFGQPDESMPQHGIARTSVWAVKDIQDSMEAAYTVLELKDGPETHEKWNHAFALQYEVLLTADSLQMTLQINNSGDDAFKFQALLHTYFKVSDISDTRIVGLAGHRYLDKATGEKGFEDNASVDLPSHTDRVYIGSSPVAKDINIFSHNLLAASISEARIDTALQPIDIVVWNPYEKSPSDLPVPHYRRFVCVEPGLVSKFYDLQPGKIAEISQKIVPMKRHVSEGLASI